MEEIKKFMQEGLGYSEYLELDENKIETNRDGKALVKVGTIVAVNFLNISCLTPRYKGRHDKNADSFYILSETLPIGFKDSVASIKKYKTLGSIVAGHRNLHDDRVRTYKCYNNLLKALNDFVLLLRYEGDNIFTELISGHSIMYVPKTEEINNVQKFIKLVEKSPITISKIHQPTDKLKEYYGRYVLPNIDKVREIMNQVNEIATQKLEEHLERIKNEQFETATETNERLDALTNVNAFLSQFTETEEKVLKKKKPIPKKEDYKVRHQQELATVLKAIEERN